MVWGSRFRVHHRVANFTDRMTRMATLRSHGARSARNRVLRVIGRNRFALRWLATELSELRCR